MSSMRSRSVAMASSRCDSSGSTCTMPAIAVIWPSAPRSGTWRERSRWTSSPSVSTSSRNTMLPSSAISAAISSVGSSAPPAASARRR
jgi:hypothetical protein